MINFLFSFFLRIALLLVPALFILPAKAQTIWFGPHVTSPDYLNLFHSDAPWQHLAAHVQVFCTSASKLLDPSVKKDLPNLLEDLRRRHIDLEVGLLPLTGLGEGQCGYHVEGYSAPGQPLSDAIRLKAAGADIRYLGMDEPLYYGHVFNGKDACHASIAEIAKDVAVKVKQVQSIYPGVAVGDVEPMGISDGAWLNELEQWFDAYQAASGQRLA